MVDVIVVEDELAHAELIRRAFESRADDFRVSVLGSIAEARERLGEHTPDLVITDLMLPDGRGIDLIPAEEADGDYPVVLMTSHGDEKVAVEAIKAGALDYVVKSADTLRTMPHVAERTLREWRQMRQLEHTQQQLLHAQKMEAIGNLSSGIAHDFNNLLMGITGCTDVALSKLDGDNPARRYIEEIKKAALRGSSLTRQLLAFTRKKAFEPRVVDFNAVVEEAQSLLSALVSEDIALDLDLSDDKLYARCDPGQVEQTLINLVVNARDAMPDGGNITVTTHATAFEAGEVRLTGDLQPGDYVVLSVRDTGTGIDEQILEHIFEPFYTTKDVGQGTGLGLSTIYGIVKQSNGEILVDSEVGEGTTFHIYLPRTDEKPEEVSEAPVDKLEGHGETVLVVEDESLVRLTVRGYLERGGYQVLTAKDGVEALAIAGGASTPIDVLLTDMVLPGLKGPDIADKVQSRHPDIAIVFMSAHSPEKLHSDGRLGPNDEVLQKPFGENELLGEVRRVLEADSGEASSVELEDTAGSSVLLIEDHETARWTFRELLEGEGYFVFEAANGAGATEIVSEHGDLLDVVISDMQLPDIGGAALAERLREEQPELRIIFTSGKDSDDPSVQKALTVDCTTFVPKPVDFDALLRVVEQMIHSARGDSRGAAQ